MSLLEVIFENQKLYTIFPYPQGQDLQEIAGFVSSINSLCFLFFKHLNTYGRNLTYE